MELINKNKKVLSIILVASLIFARSNLGITVNKWVLLINVFVNALGLVFCGLMFVQDKKQIKKGLLNPAVAWAVIFSALVFVHGHFKIGTISDFYSRQFAIMTVVPAVVIMLILFSNEKDVVEIIANAGSVIIFTTLVTSLLYDDVWKEWTNGTISDSRVGATPAGSCVDTANMMIILLIPIIYQLYFKKEIKKYILPLILGIFQIFASGSKAAIIPLGIVFVIMIVSAAEDKKTLRRNIIVLAVLAAIGTIVVTTVPLFYRIIGSRFIELFTGLGSDEYDLHTSTGQRMAVAAEFKKHFGETPLFGHGFYAFKEMAYSQLEEYKVNGVIHYRHLQIHNNFMELLFSYGIVGFVLYYWFPVYLAIKSFMSKNKQVMVLTLSFLVSFFFIDLGLDMYYKYMLPYFTYFVIYTIYKTGRDN